MTETSPRLADEYEKLITLLAKALLEQMETTQHLLELLSPEARATLSKIGKLVEKSAPPPVNIV